MGDPPSDKSSFDGEVVSCGVCLSEMAHEISLKSSTKIGASFLLAVALFCFSCEGNRAVESKGVVFTEISCDGVDLGIEGRLFDGFNRVAKTEIVQSDSRREANIVVFASSLKRRRGGSFDVSVPVADIDVITFGADRKLVWSEARGVVSELVQKVPSVDHYSGDLRELVDAATN